MQKRLSRILLRPFSLVALAAALTACGGGGGGGGNDQGSGGSADAGAGTSAPETAQDTGSVSAAFAANGKATPGYFMNGVASQVLGQLNTFTQTSSGAMAALNDTSLAGAPTATQDISGDAFQTQGRWTLGTVTNPSGTRVLSGNNAAYHYLAYNRLSAFPTSGSFTCDAGRFTAPTYIGGTAVQPAAYSGTTTSSAATLVFSSAGATVTANYNVQAGNGTESGRISVTVPGPTSTAIDGPYLGGDWGSVTAIGDGGNGTFLIAVAYKSLLSNGAIYQGVANLRCGA